ncbi:MAG TPA: hypothetical protein VM099_11915 [Gemmatimonadaceae bacterium]|nr:hypothetical protein [Gemmatimonadaceae bacterium]
MGHHISGYTGVAGDGRAKSKVEDNKIFTSSDCIPVPLQTIEQLRGCIKSEKRGRARKDQIREAVTPICAEARRSQAMPEHLLVTLKEVCRSLPEYGRMQGAVERGSFLDTVVTIAIEEYYRS